MLLHMKRNNIIGPGAALRSLRENAHLTLGEVAESAGTSQSYLSTVETGKRIPTPEYVARVTGAIAALMRTAA